MTSRVTTRPPSLWWLKRGPTVFNKVGLMERHLLLHLSLSLFLSSFLSLQLQLTTLCLSYFHFRRPRPTDRQQRWFHSRERARHRALFSSSSTVSTTARWWLRATVRHKHHYYHRHRHDRSILPHRNADVLWNKATKIAMLASTTCYTCAYAHCMFTTCVCELYVGGHVSVKIC